MGGVNERTADDPEDTARFVDQGGAMRSAWSTRCRSGTKTPQREIDLIKDRLKRLKEMLR